MERMLRKFFRCGSEDHIIVNYTNPPKDNEKKRKQVRYSERGNRASQKECNNGKNNNDRKIYASMSHVSDNEECPSRDFSDSSLLNNWILDS